VRDAVDVAIRRGRLVDSSAISRVIAFVPRVIVASPGYLSQARVPATPTDLNRHRIVGGTATVVSSARVFERDRDIVTVDVQPRFLINSNEGAVAAASGGLLGAEAEDGMTSRCTPISRWTRPPGRRQEYW
jgi:DNA-binding transcriptional LysR family regulator